jgi:hypothetical protein
MTKVIHVLLGIVFGAAGLFVFFRNVNLAKLFSEMLSYSPLTLLMCAMLPIVSIWLRAIRLRFILPDAPPEQKKGLFGLTMIEFAVNNILPGRVGEAVRALLLWRKNHFSPAVSIGSVVIERILDVLITFSFFFIPVFSTSAIRDQKLPLSLGVVHGHIPLLTLAVCFLGVFMAGAIILTAYSFFPQALKAVPRAMLQLLPLAWRSPARKLGSETLSNLNWVFSLRRVCIVLLLSVLIEAAYAASFLLLIAPLNLAGVCDSMFAQAFGAMGAAIPLAPGYIGTLHAMLLQGFSLLGYDPDKVRAVAIIYHAIGYAAVTSLGMYFIMKTHIPLKDLSRAKESINLAT